MKKYNIAVVGATGVVGSTFLKVLAEYKMPINELFLFASSKSAGKVINYEGKDVVVRELTKELQEKIIKVLSETTGVKVLSANIKVKNIYEKVKKEVKTVELKVEEPKKVDVQEAVITEVEVNDIQDEQEKAE